MRIPTTFTALFLPLTTAFYMPWLALMNCRSGIPGAVYVCSNAHFTGDCMYHAVSGECFAPPSAPMSIGPDQGGHCVVFEGRECEGEIIRWDLGDGGKK
ncbi:hypothetical protein ST47_g3705 [Ascochyta rabiei]|uniref:Uncharacterized protein n=1 Tax=Didymella rabiei TaxID=5454 RepID=A0A163H4R0_DIDRA|nr:hypothetical protein ST47_g3705 [Ascochyta rabiei]